MQHQPPDYASLLSQLAELYINRNQPREELRLMQLVGELLIATVVGIHPID